jgi:chromosome partitioning protein
VVVWDLDPQGAATYFLRARPRLKGGAHRLVGKKGALDDHIRATDYDSINVIASDFSLRNLDVQLDGLKNPVERLAALLGPITDQYDVAMLDCPPSISLASESVFGAAHALLVPTIPTPLSTRTLTQLSDFLSDWPSRPSVIPYISMIDQRRRLQREYAANLRTEWPNLMTTPIPNASIIERMSAERAPVGAFAPRSVAAEAFVNLWNEVSDRLWS